jgi:phosphoglycerate dehydrogenase-like enzyme/predicted dehydrogenase
MATHLPRDKAHPLRALVIGAGPAAVGMHLPVLARLRDAGELSLSLVCDLQSPRAQSARSRFGFGDCTGDALAALQSTDIDVVYIFGSAQLHFDCGHRALESGKHLFVEKPIAPSHAQARELAAIARAQGLVAAGGHNRRFYAALREVRARAGKAGWRFAEAVFHKAEGGKPAPFGARTWLDANGIHALDALLYVMGGAPQHLTAVAGEGGTAYPSAFSALMRWPDGAQGVFLCNNNAGARREEYVFHRPGETCTVTDAGLQIARDNTLRALALPTIGDGVSAEHEAFLQAIRSGAEPAHSIEALAPSLFVAELIERGFSGPVQLPEPERAAYLRPRASTGASILLTQPAALQPHLARYLAGYRLVSVEDLERSSNPRPDIVAAILGHDAAGLTEEIVARLPQLRVVGFSGLSLVRFNPEPLLRRGVSLVNASNAYAQTVAELALALAILGRRRASVSHELMRHGGWGVNHPPRGLLGLCRRIVRVARPAIAATRLERALRPLWKATRGRLEMPGSGPVAARDLAGATVGLIGWGANAAAFTARLLQAGARVLVYSEHARAEVIERSGATQAPLSAVLAADIVSLHRGLTQRTTHCLGREELACLRPGAVLINVARGALIDPVALLRRLERGDVFACLDTYEPEPLPRSHPLRRLPNVFLTSHIAGGSRDMHESAAEEVVRKVAAYLSGESTEVITAERLQTMT